MQRTLTLLLTLLCLASVTAAELQNVEVGGLIRIRGRYWNNVYSNLVGSPPVVRILPPALRGRPIGLFGAASRYDFDNRGDNAKFVEHDTRLHVKADFTQDVTAFIELESFDLWGEDFRANYVTGTDLRPASVNDVEFLQAYIEAREMFGYPVQLRVGRQLLKFGKGWLVDDILTAIIGQPFDGIRLTYQANDFTVDAWYAKLAENTPLEEDGDVDFYGVYGTYAGFEPLAVSAYYMLVRDARQLNDTQAGLVQEWIEDLVGYDDYEVTYLNTVGLRLFGSRAGLDYDLEAAYQFGEAAAVGVGFVAAPLIYGDDDAEFDAFAADLEIGYTIDMAWSPRVFLGGAYFDGEDNRDVSLFEWLNPFDKGEASVSFNRLFTGRAYTAILDIQQDMSNFYQIRGGVNVKPTDQVAAGLQVAYFGINEPFDLPVLRFDRHYRFRNLVTGAVVPQNGDLPWWTQEADDEIGVITHLWLKYDYSKDLFFRVGWEHLFAGDGLKDGSFLHRNGLEFSGGTDDEDADYFYWDTGLTF